MAGNSQNYEDAIEAFGRNLGYVVIVFVFLPVKALIGLSRAILRAVVGDSDASSSTSTIRASRKATPSPVSASRLMNSITNTMT